MTSLHIYAGSHNGEQFAFLMSGARTLGPKFDSEEEAADFLQHVLRSGLDPELLDNDSLRAHARAWARLTGRDWRRFA